MDSHNGRTNTWLDVPVAHKVPLTVETVLIGLILILAVVSRFVGLGDRAASHDEVNHFVPSFDLYQGKGYAYDPLSHGPLQFHLIALSYFFLGDNDASARVPAALFSVATVAIGLLAFRRYLGRIGALAAGLMFLISPYMLFYGRYARNEAFIVVWGLGVLYCILRYLERGESWVLVLYAGINAFHFVDKATAYIFAAEQALFLGVYLLYRLGRQRAVLRRGNLWQTMRAERPFDLLVLLVSLVLPLSAALPMQLAGLNPTDYSTAGILRSGLFFLVLAAAGVALGLLWRPRTWAVCAGIFYSIFALFYTTFLTNPVGLAGGLMGALGYWLQQQGVDRGSQPWYYYLFLQIPVYEFLPAFGTVLAAWFAARHKIWQSAPGDPFARPAPEDRGENPAGQDRPVEPEQPVLQVERDVDREGELETVLGEAVGVNAGRTPGVDREPDGNAVPAQIPETVLTVSEAELPTVAARPVPTAALLVYWSLSSLLAFTAAGEKMPWLTIHIAMPMILAAGWAVGFSTARLAAAEAAGRPFHKRLDWLTLLLLPLFALGVVAAVASLGRLAVGQGSEQDPARLALGLAVALLSAALLGNLTRNWGGGQLGRVMLLLSMAFLAILTARAAYRAAFLLYDYPDEYLVYAHSAPDPKRLLADLNTIAERTNTGDGLVVAYDNYSRYPYWWYLRRYPNRIDYDVQPTVNIRKAAVVFAGAKNYARVEPILRGDYIAFDYVRLWWPNQDYWRLKYDSIAAERTNPTGSMGILEYLQRAWGHIRPFFTNERVRSAVWQIWFNRDFREWAALQANPSLYTHIGWDPADRMRMYVRRDVAARAGYLTGGDATVSADPYEKVTVPLAVERAVGQGGNAPGQFSAPHAVALAPDGSLYVADGLNHRIQHLNPDGSVIKVWGSPADASKGDAPGGTFNEPWGVAVGPDGAVYVSDTWNHRVQKFTADGQFVTMWGHLQQGGSQDGFYGPRGIAVDGQGRVYVADTGNKRVAVFDSQGGFVTSIGSPGAGPGQLDEPVGVALDSAGNVYVVDTWNRRVQVFSPGADGYSVKAAWGIEGWYGQSVDNKPFIAVDGQGNSYVTDPEGCRVLAFGPDSNPIRAWNGCNTGAANPSQSSGFVLPSGIAVDASGGVWVSDAAANRLVYFRGR